jgi:hypothetical protein
MTDDPEQPKRTLKRPRIAPGVHVRRATPKRRRQIDEVQATEAMDRRTQTLDALSEVVSQLTGLEVTGSHAEHNGVYELVVDIDFAGPRSGRVSLALSRGLTRQVGAAMAAMVNLDGRPLNAIDAAKELASAVAHKILQDIFGSEVRCHMRQAEASPSRPLADNDVVSIGVNDGIVAVRLHLHASAL